MSFLLNPWMLLFVVIALLLIVPPFLSMWRAQRRPADEGRTQTAEIDADLGAYETAGTATARDENAPPPEGTSPPLDPKRPGEPPQTHERTR